MAKAKKIELPQEATEIIETTLSELDLLTRAFDLIAQVCEETSAPRPEKENDSPPPEVEEEGVVVH